MMQGVRIRLRGLKPREKRMLFYLLPLLLVAAWKYVPRPWHPTITIETPYQIIYSTATRGQTEDTARTMELLYVAYSNWFGTMPQFQSQQSKLKVKLFKDRAELRRINPGMG